MKSEWSAITAQPYRCDNKHRGKHQSEPETRRTQVSYWRELWAVDRVHVEGKSLRRESHHTVFQHRAEMGSAERDLLEESDRQKRQDSPKKCRPPGPP